MSDDDRWSDVLDQVADALGEVNLGSDQTRDALIEGVREALESLEGGIDLNVEIVADAESDPSMDVSVVPGGRGADEPPTPGEKPNLRVAEASADTADMADTVDTAGPVITKVKVLRTPPRKMGRTSSAPEPTPNLSAVGWISVAAGGSADAGWQTVYQGHSPRVYRVACTRGILDVTVDGAQVERLRPGQSLDVEGALIRVTTTDLDGAQGGYAPAFAGPAFGEE